MPPAASSPRRWPGWWRVAQRDSASYVRAAMPHDGLHEKPYHHGNLPAALVDAALEVLESEGIEALTLRELARRVGVTHAAPYRHFKDKAALLAALAAEGFARLSRAVEARRGEGIAGAAEAYLRFAADHPAHFRLMFAPERAADPAVSAAAS